MIKNVSVNRPERVTVVGGVMAPKEVHVFRVRASLVAQMVRNLPAGQETRAQSLGGEDPLERGMATPVFLSEESHGQRSLGGLQSTASQRIGRD